MNRLSIVLVLAVFMIFNCVNADNSTPGETLGLKIKTVDENNNPLKVDTVRWWLPKIPDQIFELSCESDLCSDWEIKENISGTITIHAYLSKVKKNDKYCWDLYGGETLVTMPTKKVTIVIKFKNTACSSAKTIYP